jgi:hypothetical protein
MATPSFVSPMRTLIGHPPWSRSQSSPLNEVQHTGGPWGTQYEPLCPVFRVPDRPWIFLISPQGGVSRGALQVEEQRFGGAPMYNNLRVEHIFIRDRGMFAESHGHSSAWAPTCRLCRRTRSSQGGAPGPSRTTLTATSGDTECRTGPSEQQRTSYPPHQDQGGALEYVQL